MLWSFKTDESSTNYTPWGQVEDGIFTEFEDVSPSKEFLEMFSIKSSDGILPSFLHFGNICHGTLEEFIKKYFKGQESLRVTGMRMSKNNKDICIFTNSTYCANLRRKHKSNHIYFVINSKGHISQRCTDADCKTFHGRSYQLPNLLKDLYTGYIKC
jgi:hypothetical protein